MQEISLPAEELVAFQEGLCCMYFSSSYSCDCIALPIPTLQTKALHSSSVSNNCHTKLWWKSIPTSLQRHKRKLSL